MAADPSDDMFWNLVAAYADGRDVAELKQESRRFPGVFPRFLRHVLTCDECRELRSKALAERAARNPTPEDW